MNTLTILLSMPTWISLFLLCLLRSVHGAFTTAACDVGRSICVQQSQSGSFCFYSTLISSYSACNAPYSLPLVAHLNQGYAIGYYTATGQYLGRSNYPIRSGSTTAIYVCMSARVSTTQYYTLCALATADNSWQANGCAVGVAPLVVDGCYASPPRTGTTPVAITTTTTTRLSTTVTRVSTSYAPPTLTTTRTNAATFIDVSTPAPSVITTTRDGTTLVLTTTVGAPAASIPLATTATTPKRDLLKDSAYSIIWAPITIVLGIIGLVVKLQS